MERQKPLKYEYVPDISHIMKQAGYRMGLLDILEEASVPMPKRRIPPAPEPYFRPEIFRYSKRDING